jgi:hypothetical protein
MTGAPRAFLGMARTLALVFVMTLVASRAWAGLDCDPETAVKDVEAAAKDKAKVVDAERNYSFLCAEGLAAKWKPRIGKACEKLLDRDGEKGNPCVVVAASAGLVKLGKHDLFELVGKIPEDPIESDGGVGFRKTDLYAAMNDPRGAAAIMEMWKAAIPRAEAREKKHRQSMADWSSWRQSAAINLGKLGGADAKTFLEDQAKATVDTHVRDACNDAAAAIAKRIT